MADTVQITAGTGTVIATDDVAGTHYQQVKLVDGTLDSTTVIASGNGTAASALRVTLPTDGTGVVGLNAGTNNIGDVDVLTVPAPLSTTGGGTEATALRVTVASDSTGVLSVDDNAGSLTVDAPVATPVFVRLSDGAAAITTLPVSLASAPSTPVTNAGTFATQVDGSALTALQLIDDPVFTDDAAFTVGTSKVNMAGVQVVNFGTTPDVADSLDAGAIIANRHRIPFMLGGHPNIQSSEYFTSGAITDDNILPALAAGSAYVITGITVACSAANATSPSVRIGFGTSTLTAQGATNADAVAKIILSHPGIPAGSGIVKGYNGGIVGIGASDEELRITCTTPTTSLIVQVDWFTISI